ncbi:hypothetical protein F5B17DRAFT_400385, partial [Nemania serpens]
QQRQQQQQRRLGLYLNTYLYTDHLKSSNQLPAIMPVKPRCTFKECKTAAQRIVGDCGFCDGHFCAKHRLLEDHKCTGLEDVSPTQPPADSFHSIMRNGGSGELAPDTTTQWWLVGLAEYLTENDLLP